MAGSVFRLSAAALRPTVAAPCGSMVAGQCGDLSPNVENAIRTHLSVGNGILKVAAMIGVESDTVWRIKREMVAIASCRPASTGRGD